MHKVYKESAKYKVEQKFRICSCETNLLLVFFYIFLLDTIFSESDYMHSKS